MLRTPLALACVLSSGLAYAGEDFGKGTIIFARGRALYRVDATGKGETEVASFVTKGPVRALRTDALGSILLADIGGTWGWMPLDGSTRTLTSLPCAEGPAQLAEDGSAVVCRSAKTASGARAIGVGSTSTLIVNLATLKTMTLDVPVAGARIVGSGATRRLVWADPAGVWAAPLDHLKTKTQLAPEAPLRSFLPNPDGTRAVGVYADYVFEGVRTKKPADVLMSFQLDGTAARRKSIKSAIPLEWSHDAKWVLVQDAAKACVMSAQGGEYKCWRGFTAGALSADGRWSLLLGNRDRVKAPEKPKGKSPTKAKQPTKPTPPTPAKAPAKPSDDEISGEPEVEVDSDDEVSDVAIALPSGPLALYRGRLDGAFTDAPSLLVKIVDGAAVWVPAKPAPAPTP